jgi:hypothetical protein
LSADLMCENRFSITLLISGGSSNTLFRREQ